MITITETQDVALLAIGRKTGGKFDRDALAKLSKFDRRCAIALLSGADPGLGVSLEDLDLCIQSVFCVKGVSREGRAESLGLRYAKLDREYE